MPAPKNTSAQRAVSPSKAPLGRGDQTGLQARQLEAERQQELAQAEAERQEVRAAEEHTRKVGVIDYTKMDTPLIEEKPEDEDEQADRIFICKYEIDRMAYGIETDENGDVRHGKIRYLSFVEGQRYKVSGDLYKHLNDRGYVFH